MYVCVQCVCVCMCSVSGDQLSSPLVELLRNGILRSYLLLSLVSLFSCKMFANSFPLNLN